jgi:hypothetical protein
MAETLAPSPTSAIAKVVAWSPSNTTTNHQENSMNQEKKCSQCGRTKPLAAFWKNKTSGDGRRTECAECAKKNKRERGEYYRQYNLENRDKLLVMQRQYNRSPAGKRRSRTASKRSVNSGANSAYYAVTKAVRENELPPISDCKCTDCGGQAAEYHHYLGYEEEHRLDVLPLCRVCHIKAHQD